MEIPKENAMGKMRATFSMPPCPASFRLVETASRDGAQRSKVYKECRGSKFDESIANHPLAVSQIVGSLIHPESNQSGHIGGFLADVVGGVVGGVDAN